MKEWEAEHLAARTARHIRALDRAEADLDYRKGAADPVDVCTCAVCSSSCLLPWHALLLDLQPIGVVAQLKRLVAKQAASSAPPSHLSWRDMLAVLKDSLRDLKLADDVADAHLKTSAIYSIAREATGILERSASLPPHRLVDTMDMTELAVSAMSMLSTRPDGRGRLREGACIAALVAAFKPGMDDLVLEHIGSALGNLANHAAARQQMRDAGVVGMVTRLLRLSHRPRAQVAASVALALAAAKDGAMQDSARYIGAIPSLVDMVASYNATVSEVGRLALLSLRHRNSRNADEILCCMRSCRMAHDDILRLSYTESLLHLEHGRLATLMDELDAELARPRSHAARPRSASPTRSFAAPAYVAHTPPSRVREKLDDVYAELERTASPRIGAARTRLPATTLPLRAYCAADVSQLLYDLCVPSRDVDALRRAAVDGAALPTLDRHYMEAHLGLSRAAVRAVTVAQRAARLFERIARRGRQSRLSELDLRVWLMGTGVAASAVNRVADRFRTMSFAGDGLVSFAELAANFTWFDAELKCAGAYL